jgi:homoserine dehydrogenase
MDDIMLYGRGAGAMPTASAVVSDVIYAATHIDVKYSTFKNTAAADRETKFVSDFESAYYLRLSAADEAGVLAKVSGIFAKYGVSIVELVQKGTASGDGRVPLILVTHVTTESSVRSAVSKINISGIAHVEAVIRVEA